MEIFTEVINKNSSRVISQKTYFFLRGPVSEVNLPSTFSTAISSDPYIKSLKPWTEPSQAATYKDLICITKKQNMEKPKV